ncbi:MAG: class I SAM-dependent methyltransferase [Actinomycetota bacterium]
MGGAGARRARGVVPGLSKPKSVIAADYDLSGARFSEFADRLVYSHLAAPLAERVRACGTPALDVASGTGALGRRLDDVVAMDISHGQLVNNPLALRVQADAECLPFVDGVFAAAASAFGINHFPDPVTAVREMARVARTVALMTWVRPEEHPYPPKVAVLEVIEKHAGRAKTKAGELVERMSEETGSESALARVFDSAGLTVETETISVEVPWPGAEAFVDYRFSMASVLAHVEDVDRVRTEAVAAVRGLSESEVSWRPRLVLAVGTRPQQAAGG